MSDFSLKEIIGLIKACRASGVDELALKDLRIVMNKVGTPPITPEIVPEGSITKVEKIQKESVIEENLSFNEDLLAHSIVEDPSEYERQIIAGELEEGEKTQDQ